MSGDIDQLILYRGILLYCVCMYVALYCRQTHGGCWYKRVTVVVVVDGAVTVCHVGRHGMSTYLDISTLLDKYLLVV